MFLPLVLTIVAIAGVMLAVLLGQPKRLSNHLGAAGGGLLLGIATFWLLPEIADELGWMRSLAMAAGIGLVLAALERALMHGGHSLRQGVAGPLLLITALHSFLDGWSVRAAAGAPVVDVAVPLGLALHKIPEGLALGWVTRQRFHSAFKAVAAGAFAELFTLAGAFAEPHAQRSGVYHFGVWWTATVLALIAGTFAFLGLHAVWPGRRDKGVIIVFLATTLVVAFAAVLR